MRQIALFLDPKGTVLEVVRTAKQRGLFVVAAVSDETLLHTAPEPYHSAVGCIDQIIPVDTWNDATAHKVANTLRPLGKVVCVYSGFDPCAVVSAKLRQEFGLPTTSPEILALILNKQHLRTRLKEHGLSHIKSVSQSVADKWQSWEFGGAAYFNPVHGFFSAYVKRCESWEDFKAARSEWEKGNASDPAYVKNYVRSENEYYLEEAFDGELLSVESISSSGKFQCLGLLSRILYSKNPIVEMGSCFPYPHTFRDKIVAAVEKGHEMLGFTEGATHVEVIVSKSGEVEIIDFNPRFVGADVLQSVNNAYGIRIEEQLLDWACGKSPVIETKNAQHACLQYILSPESLQFDSISFPKVTEVKFKTTFVKPGMKLSSIDRQLDYIGCYLTVMPTFESALSRSKELRSEIKINGHLEGAY